MSEVKGKKTQEEGARRAIPSPLTLFSSKSIFLTLTLAKNCSSPPQQSSIWHFQCQCQELPGGWPWDQSYLRSSNIHSKWGAGQISPNISPHRPISALTVNKQVCTSRCSCPRPDSSWGKAQLRTRGRGFRQSALWTLLLLTFLYAALLGHVFFALVKWKFSREAKTLFTFRFDRLWKNMKMEGKDRRKKTEQWILKHARKTKMETMMS